MQEVKIMTPKQQAYETLAKTMIKNFEKRNIDAFYCPTKEDAVTLVMELMKEGGTVSMGGSATVRESGLLDAIQSTSSIRFIARDVAKPPEEKKAIFL